MPLTSRIEYVPYFEFARNMVYLEAYTDKVSLDLSAVGGYANRHEARDAMNRAKNRKLIADLTPDLESFGIIERIAY